MRKFWVFVKFHFLARITYRGDMIVYSFSSALSPLIGLAIWMSVSASGVLPYSRSETFIYFLAVMYVGIMTEMWQAWFINWDINSGEFSGFLLKPQTVFSRYMTELLSDKIYKMSMVSLTLPIVYYLTPAELWTNFFIALQSVLLFLIALIIGFLIVFWLEILVGLSAVWFYDIGFIKNYLDVANTFFAGKFIPLSFLPIFLYDTALYLPFRYSVSFPIELLLNKLNSSQILWGFIIECTWLVVMYVAYIKIKHLFDKAYKGYGA